jgi:SAM-dependent methyltransferase
MKPDWIARQSRSPAGWLGQIVARVMSFETQAVNRDAVDRLGAQRRDAVLEVGCGHGRTLARIAAAPVAFAAGVDPSPVMIDLARKRMRRWIEAGLAEVAPGSGAGIPHPDGRFDAALAVHVVYFWSDGVPELREIRRVLRPGGKLLLAYRPRDEAAVATLPATVYALRSEGEVEALLAEAGFTESRTAERTIGKMRCAFTTARA